jgi:hypothetical protein
MTWTSAAAQHLGRSGEAGSRASHFPFPRPMHPRRRAKTRLKVAPAPSTGSVLAGLEGGAGHVGSGVRVQANLHSD